MICAQCQKENPTDARFCLDCGAALAPTCPHCGAHLPAGARFCSNCGRQLAVAQDLPENAPSTPPPSDPRLPELHLQQFIPPELLARLESTRAAPGLAGERRVVTMLFCDVEGSTAAASRLDPEEWAEIINGAFEHMIRPVYKYEGTVARLMGDGLLAFFGAPISHEDDPQRAALAGLQILDAIRRYQPQVARRWGIELGVRVGINTGLVVVGTVGSDLRLEYTALGDAINLAARMEQTAEPGTVQVSEATWKLIAPLFEGEVRQAVAIKGRSEPVRAYRLLGPKVEPGRLRGIAGLDAPLIGRDRSLAALQAALNELKDGRGGIVSVMGEAGLGKSRLLAELRKTSTGDPGPRLQWLETRSLSYETLTPYAPFSALFAGFLGIEAGEPDEEKYARLKSRLTILLPDCAGELAPFLAALMGVSPTGEDLERVKYLEPPQLRSLIFTKVRTFFERLAAGGPLVVVFDDLHWIDPTSLDLLESLLPLADRLAVLLIAAFRPRRQEPSWRFHTTVQQAYAKRYISIPLEPLNEPEARELLGSLLQIEDLPEKVRRLILERAEGNPFFVEELIRSLLDAGLVERVDGRWRAAGEIEKLEIPTTLIGVITARLDRLPESARQMAQVAAVIGREFSHSLISSLVAAPELLEAGLVELQRRELIREAGDSTGRTYRFKHVLTQEAAYGSILLSRRRELHERVAEGLALRQPDQPAGIARHFIEARQPARAAPYLLAAGERAARSYASPEAIAFFSQVLDLRSLLAAQSSADRALVRSAFEGLGGALTFANRIPEAVENYRRMLVLAEEQADIPMQVSALTKLASVLALRMGQFAEAETAIARADRLAHQYDVKAGIPEMAILRCQMCMASADFDRVVEHMGEVIAIGQELEVKEHLSMAMEHVATSLMFLTRFDEAWEKGQAGLEVAREIGDREHEANLLTQALPFCLACWGELDEARRVAEAGVQISARIGAVIPLVYGNWLLGEIARWRGEYERAIVYGQRALEASLPVEPYMPFITVQPLGSLGTAYLEISGHFSDPVARFHRHALRLLEDPAGMVGGGTAWADLGFCALILGDLQAAENSFQKGLHHPSMFMLVERPRHLAGLALLALARGEADGALRLVQEASDYAGARAMKSLAPFLALTTGRVQAARGEAQAALELFERAETLALDLGLRPIIWQARAAAALSLEAAGQENAAQERRLGAQAMVAEIAGLFHSEDLRAAFLANARNQFEMP